MVRSLKSPERVVMLELVEDRKQLKIFVSPDAKKAVEAFAESFDMTEMGVASRIYEWFGSLPRPVQKWITGLTDANEGEGMKKFAAELLQASEAKLETPVRRPKVTVGPGEANPRNRPR
jgi:hypothetical protein